jgi:hypothetical protein
MNENPYAANVGGATNMTVTWEWPADETDLTAEQLTWMFVNGTPVKLARTMPWRIRLRRAYRALRGRP